MRLLLIMFFVVGDIGKSFVVSVVLVVVSPLSESGKLKLPIVA